MYRPTIGLEIHAELATQTKMFCACLNNPDEKEPNKNICPVCMAHPGSLPVINREAVHKVLLVGTAVEGTLADFTEFDRKNYFYPDIPKGYQISQYKYPLVSGGSLNGVEITRVHLEEDTARSQHDGEVSLVDYNRAGVPLMELVTEPVIHDAQTAGAFARELQLLLRYLGAGEANMEKGEMRVEANISVSKDDTLGTKVEVKNLNSFRSVERAIAYEVERQSILLEKGEKVVQETRGWDEQKQTTFSQRKKESSHDYRYFPDPDLPKLKLSEIKEFSSDKLKKELPELPWDKRKRYSDKYGVTKEVIETLVSNSELAKDFESWIASLKGNKAYIRAVADLILPHLVSKDTWSNFSTEPQAVGFSAVMYVDGTLSSTATKTVLDYMVETGLRDPQTVAKEKGLLQQSDSGALETIAKKVAEANPGPVDDYKAGKEEALQYLVGQGMKESKGSANPAALREALIKILG